MADSTKQDGNVGKPSIGLYGSNPASMLSIAKPAPGESSGNRDRNVILTPNTNIHPAWGLEQRRQRNINRTRGMFRTNISPVFRHSQTPSGSGMKVVEALNSPSVQAWVHLAQHPERKGWAQTPDQVVQANRNSQNSMRTARIRAAAPAQVSWKVPYVVGQRNVQPIGPYQSLKQRSILYRLSDYLSTLGGGGNA